jgi:WD40 repeat protein
MDDLDFEELVHRFAQYGVLELQKLEDGVRIASLFQVRLQQEWLTFRNLKAQRFLQRTGIERTTDWQTPPEIERYVWTHLAHFARLAELQSWWQETVQNPDYLAARIVNTDIGGAEKDIELALDFGGNVQPLQQLRTRFVQSIHILSKCLGRDEILATLASRVLPLERVNGVPIRLSPPWPDMPHPSMVRALTGHTDRVNALAFSPDGSFVVSASDDRTLNVWNPRNGELIETLSGHAAEVIGCVISPGGAWLASFSKDGRVKLWNTFDWNEGPSVVRSNVTDCVFSSDGSALYLATDDGELLEWKVFANAPTAVIWTYSQGLHRCELDRSGAELAIASRDGKIHLFRIPNGPARSLDGQRSTAASLAISPDGGLVASSWNDGTIKVYDRRNLQYRYTLIGHEGRVRSCNFSPDGKSIVSASDDHTIRLWDAVRGAPTRLFFGHTAWVSDCLVNPSGEEAVSSSYDRTVRLWNLKQKTDTDRPPGHRGWVRSAVVALPSLVTTSDDRTVKVWDIETRSEMRTFEGHQRWVTCCAVANDQIWSGSEDGKIKVWDFGSGAQLAEFTVSTKVEALAVNPDATLIAAAYGNEIQLWWASNFAAAGLISVNAEVRACAFLSQNSLIVGLSDSTLQMLGTGGGSPIQVLEGHDAPVTDCFQDLTGQIISASTDRTIRIWLNGRLERTLTGHREAVTACAMNFTTNQLASVSRDGMLRLWDANTWETISALFVDGPLFDCAFIDHRLIAVGAAGIFWFEVSSTPG